MKMRNQVIAVVMLCTTSIIGHASNEYMQPNMPMYMADPGHMPMRGPYPPPMYPMHQQPHQAVPTPADNSPAASPEPSAAQQSVDGTNKQASASIKPEYCQHKPNDGTNIYKIRAMQRQQDKMQKHMQRMETHLANIEGLIRQMVENR